MTSYAKDIGTSVAYTVGCSVAYAVSSSAAYAVSRAVAYAVGYMSQMSVHLPLSDYVACQVDRASYEPMIIIRIGCTKSASVR